jgi:hypothetical protein
MESTLNRRQEALRGPGGREQEGGETGSRGVHGEGRYFTNKKCKKYAQHNVCKH